MFSKLKPFAVLALLMSFIAPAMAADNDLIIPAQQEEYVPVEIGSGWYIRGDIGYNVNGRQDNSSFSVVPVTFNSAYSDAITAGVGFGYKFGEILRADATVDRVFGGGFNNTQLISPVTGPCLGLREVPSGFSVVWQAQAITNCLRKDESAYKMWSAMANIYADLATVSGFTPYIGAGLGVARVTWQEETGSVTCIPVSADVAREVCSAQGTIAQPLPNEIYTEPGTFTSGASWKLAMAVTAGVSYELSKGMHLDTSYKFTSIGGGFGSIPYTANPGSSIDSDGFGLHQVKVGLRYEIW
jgi:opacity protein-like surface antigen